MAASSTYRCFDRISSALSSTADSIISNFRHCMIIVLINYLLSLSYLLTNNSVMVMLSVLAVIIWLDSTAIFIFLLSSINCKPIRTIFFFITKLVIISSGHMIAIEIHVPLGSRWHNLGFPICYRFIYR